MLFVVKPCRCVNVYYSHWYRDSGLFSVIKYWLDGDIWCFGCCAVTCHTAFHAFGLKTHLNTIMSRKIWICFSVFLNNLFSRQLELTFLFSLKGKYLNLFWHKRHSYSVSLPYSPEVSAVPAFLWRLVFQSTVSFCFFHRIILPISLLICFINTQSQGSASLKQYANAHIDAFCWCGWIFMRYLSMRRHKYFSNFPPPAFHPDLQSAPTLIRVRWAASVCMSVQNRSDTAVLKVTHEGCFLQCASVSWTMINTAVCSGLREFLKVRIWMMLQSFLFSLAPPVSVDPVCLSICPALHTHFHSSKLAGATWASPWLPMSRYWNTYCVWQHKVRGNISIFYFSQRTKFNYSLSSEPSHPEAVSWHARVSC